MLNVTVENIGELAVVECEGRIVQSEAAFKLRKVVTSQTDARIVVRHRRWWSRHAGVPAPMGARPQHPFLAI